MNYLVRHQTFIFLFFTFPLLGWSIHKYFSKKAISYTLIASLALLVPALTGYSYVIDNTYGYLLYLLLAGAYALMHKDKEYKFVPTVVFSAVLFLICGFLSFIGGIAGSVTVERQWNLKGYRVEYLRDQGFAGGPRLVYELSKYAAIPIFIKKVETGLDNGTTNTCWVKFPATGFNFNKCDPDSSVIIKHNVPEEECNEETAKKWIQQTKDDDLSVFMNLIIEPRGEISPDKLRYTNIEITSTDTSSILIPLSDRGISPNLYSRFKRDIDKFAKINKVRADSAVHFTELYGDTIMNRFHRLKAISSEGYPRLGEFITFRTSSGCEIIYCPDTLKIREQYWKEFFRKTKTIEDHWYWASK